jgi:hypothetical protein
VLATAVLGDLECSWELGVGWVLGLALEVWKVLVSK